MAMTAIAVSDKGEDDMAFLGLQLEAHDLSELMDFYVNQLGMTLLEHGPEYLDIRAGQTKLCFTQTGGDLQPVYRFALNLTPSTSAQTLYDPAGNRVDITGERRLSIGVVRLALPVDDTEVTAYYLQNELALAQSSSGDYESGTRLVGDENCAFMLVKRGNSAIYPIVATVPGSILSETKVLNYPYYIHQWRDQ